MKNRLRELREERRLTLRELSEKVNISYSNIAMIERGERNLTSDTLIIFADFFEVSTDYLLGKTDKRTPNTPNSLPLTPEQIQVAFYNQNGILTEGQKKDVEIILEYIKNNPKLKGE